MNDQPTQQTEVCGTFDYGRGYLTTLEWCSGVGGEPRNPYRSGSTEHLAWDAGHRAALEDNRKGLFQPAKARALS